MRILEFANRKEVRAKVLADYCHRAGYAGCVCFSCGNASKALRDTGLYTVDVSPRGGLSPNCWWTPSEIHKAWPHLFDATSGHLHVPLLWELARAYRLRLGALMETYYEVPTGSGETIVSLKMAYPAITFVAVYNGSFATQYGPLNPMNELVRRMFDVKGI